MEGLAIIRHGNAPYEGRVIVRGRRRMSTSPSWPGTVTNLSGHHQGAMHGPCWWCAFTPSGGDVSSSQDGQELAEPHRDSQAHRTDGDGQGDGTEDPFALAIAPHPMTIHVPERISRCAQSAHAPTSRHRSGDRV